MLQSFMQNNALKNKSNQVSKQSFNFAIVGFGRFGKTLARMLFHFSNKIYVFDKFLNANQRQNALKLLAKELDVSLQQVKQKIIFVNNIKELYKNSFQYVFFAVPINKFKSVVNSHVKYIPADVIAVDVLSVKMYALNIFNQIRKRHKNLQIILTHPMFGPDSSKNGFKGLPLVVYNLSANNSNYYTLLSLLKRIGLKIVKLTPQEHDKMAAYSQGVTHFIGRILEKFKLKPTPIDTLGAKKLQEIMQQTINDSFELFKDLQQYNPYTPKMRYDFGKAYDFVFNKLLPKKVNPPYITIGIQGGKGSFNEMLAYKFIKEYKIKNPKIIYLYTTEKVLTALDKGKIDLGIFAVHNATGGIVWESAKAMANHKFKIKYELKLLIAHYLMKLPSVKKEEITQVMAHPQVLKQCQKTLRKRYPNLKQLSGKGELIDTAKAAKALFEGKLPKTTAILGPKILADIYNLEIIDSNLQDIKDNYTYFWVVER